MPGLSLQKYQALLVLLGALNYESYEGSALLSYNIIASRQDTRPPNNVSVMEKRKTIYNPFTRSGFYFNSPTACSLRFLKYSLPFSYA